MTDGRPTGTPAYRGDVQGMRALAVLAVIVAHADIPKLQGGFVGVDVFFVISGFLITRLILGGVESETGFRLRDFYARRARRILPAATLVLLVTVVASMIYLNFIDALAMTKDTLFAALFVVNFRFASEGTNYFDQENSPSPLQHFWSLSVEEQFYVVWPIAVALVVLLVRARRRNRVKRTVPVKSLFVVALAIGGASLAYSIHETRIEPTGAYFSTLTRAWELAAGCLVALLLHGGRRIPWRPVSEVLALAGLAGIVVAVLRYNDTMAFPGYEALLPVLAAVALLIGGADVERQPWTSQALSLRPMRTLGDWSYSLYLWHWPLLFIPLVSLGHPLNATETAIALAITLEFSYITYKYVEQPFRTKQLWRRSYRGLVLYPLSLVLVLPAVYAGHAYSIYQGTHRGHNPAISAQDFGLDSSVTSLVQASVDAAQAGKPIPSDLHPSLLDLHDDLADVGQCDYEKPARPLCRRGDVNSDKVMVVTGDSHARAWIPAFEKIAQAAGYATYYLVKQQCTAAYVDPGQLGTGAPWPECDDFHQWVLDEVKKLHPDVMVVATSPPPTGVYEGGKLVKSRVGVEKAMAGGFDDMFSAYQPYVKDLRLIVDVPRLAQEPSECLADSGATMSTCTLTPTPESLQYQHISERSAERMNVPFVDPTPWFCAPTAPNAPRADWLCPMVVGSTIAYRDRAHISATRSAQLWGPLGVKLGLLPAAEGFTDSGDPIRGGTPSSGSSTGSDGSDDTSPPR